jgi:hypothetical protein
VPVFVTLKLQNRPVGLETENWDTGVFADFTARFMSHYSIKNRAW